MTAWHVAGGSKSTGLCTICLTMDVPSWKMRPTTLLDPDINENQLAPTG